MPEVNLRTGVTLAFDDVGDGAAPPLILLHGVSMSKRYFHHQLETLGTSHRVLAVDLRGHGRSEKTADGHTIPQYARDLEAFIEALGIDQPVLLGWSMGAFVAWDYIEQFGTSTIAGLIVTDEAASDYKWDDFPHGLVDFATLHAFMTAVQDDRDQFLRDLIPQMFHREQSDTDLAWMFDECASLPVGATSGILYDQCVRDYRETVTKIDVPNLICWGRHDALLPVSGAQHLLEHTPGAELVIFEESGHCPFIEESDKFNETVSSFLTRLERIGIAYGQGR
jgi:pimeloyl-ACP methyl ester carboxylesterase